MKNNKANRITAGCLGLATLFVASFGQLPVAQSQAAMSVPVRPSLEMRSAYATSLEEQMRGTGVDARVQVDGDQRDILRIDWPQAGRRDVYKLVNSVPVRDGAQEVGFRSIVLSNGKHQWNYDLAKESMVWSPVEL